MLELADALRIAEAAINAAWHRACAATERARLRQMREHFKARAASTRAAEMPWANERTKEPDDDSHD